LAWYPCKNCEDFESTTLGLGCYTKPPNSHWIRWVRAKKQRDSSKIWVNLITTSLFSRTLELLVYFREIIPFYGLNYLIQENIIYFTQINITIDIRDIIGI